MKSKMPIIIGTVALFLGAMGIAIAQNSKSGTSASTSTCSEATARLSFQDVCVGGLFMYAGNDIDKIRTECKCAATRFPVNKIVEEDLKKCKWEATDVHLVRKLMAVDAVKLACR